MITRVQVKNYRSLKDVDVTLGPLNILVGKNGAGKSAFLDVLAFVRDALTTNLRYAVSERAGFPNLAYNNATYYANNVEIDIDVSAKDYRSRYSLELMHEGIFDAAVAREAASARSNAQSEQRLLAANGVVDRSISTFALPNTELAPAVGLLLPTMLPFLPECKRLMDELSTVGVYTLPPSKVNGLQEQLAPLPLTSHGDNLASYLRWLCENESAKSNIISSLKRIVADISDIKVRETPGFFLIELAHTLDASPVWRSIGQESDGTVRALGIIAALSQPAQAGVIAIEEPELHLHPGALAVLADVIHEASTRRQVIITTQSPDLISHFTADELRIVENVDGETRIGPIEERQREAINAELFSGGDLLRIEGLHAAGAANA